MNMVRLVHLFVCAGIVLCGHASARAALTIGDRAPDFTAPWYTASGSTGSSFTLSSDAAGKVVYMQFVTPKDAASLVLMRIAQEGLYPEFAENSGVVLITVIAASAPHTAADALTLMSNANFTSQALLDLDGTLFARYAVEDAVQVYILDRDGTVKFAPAQPAGLAFLVDALNDILQDVGDIISVTTNKSAYYGAGDLVQIGVDVLQPVAEPFDGYCGIRLPDLSYLSITPAGGLTTGIWPLVTGVPSLSAPAHYALFQAAIPPDIAPGSYLIRAALVQAGTGVFIAESNAVVEVR
jgi:hypothetical protein